jgi:hypothetical protein
LLAHFPHILANELQDLTKKSGGERKKSYSRRHAKLCEKADSLKVPGSVANYLRNGIFYPINDNNMRRAALSRGKLIEKSLDFSWSIDYYCFIHSYFRNCENNVLRK